MNGTIWSCVGGCGHIYPCMCVCWILFVKKTNLCSLQSNMSWSNVLHNTSCFFCIFSFESIYFKGVYKVIVCMMEITALKFNSGKGRYMSFGQKKKKIRIYKKKIEKLRGHDDPRNLSLEGQQCTLKAHWSLTPYYFMPLYNNKILAQNKLTVALIWNELSTHRTTTSRVGGIIQFTWSQSLISNTMLYNT